MFLRLQLWLILVFAVNAVNLAGAAGKYTLLAELDNIVENTEPYENAFKAETGRLRHRLDVATADSVRFAIMQELFGRYRNFRIDSALIISKQLVELSASLGDDSRNSAHMNYADALNKSGIPSASVTVLNRIPRTDSVKRDVYFYYLYHTAYLSLSRDNMDPKMERTYMDKLDCIKDTLISLHEKGSAGYVSNLAGKLADEGKTSEAISVLEEIFSQENANIASKDSASLEYQIAELYLLRGDTASAIGYLAKASISDLRQAKKIYKSLQRLALVLYQQGDVERAYRYIMKSINDINFGNARYRLYDIAEYMPIIASAYDMQQRSSSRKHAYAIVLLALFLGVLGVACYQLKKKKEYMAMAKSQLERQNVQLKEFAEDLRRSNQNLKESNRIKVEYIASLFNICSDYIKRQEEFRKSLSRKLASNQIAEVTKIVNKQASVSEDFKQFINKFDAIFLSIFPDFVAQFNALLRPEEQIVLKKDELLTPELRIYALIRLGITENTKIADFLHYSLQTVYNYRQKMRNKAIDREQKLSDMLLKIGYSEK